MKSQEKQQPPANLRVSRLDHASGEYVVFSWPAEREAPAPRSGAPAPAAGGPALTAAERAVHALLLAGLSDAEIAELRGTTRSTVTKQVDAVFRKLGVRSRRELIARG